MEINSFKFASNHFYKYTGTPIALFNEKVLIFPEIKLTIDQINEIYSFFPLLKDIINRGITDTIVSDGTFLVAQLDIEVDGNLRKAIIGPTRVQGEVSPHPYLSNIISDLSSASEEDFIDNVMFASLLLDSTLVEKPRISYHSKHKTQKSSRNKFMNILSERRDQSFTKDSYQMELRIIHYIRTQKLERIKWVVRSLEKENLTPLSKNAIHSLKYKFVSFVAIITRQAINDGIPLEKSFSLSDSLIKELDNLDTPRQIIDFILYASEHFIFLYREQTCGKLSSEIKQVINYIDSNLYQKISLSEISDSVNMTPSYLSFKFKKETGQKISDYILRQRVEEAKEILLFTSKSYQEIATQLNFSSQSYFIKCFKKVTNHTPKEYRESNWQYNIWY